LKYREKKFFYKSLFDVTLFSIVYENAPKEVKIGLPIMSQNLENKGDISMTLALYKYYSVMIASSRGFSLGCYPYMALRCGTSSRQKDTPLLMYYVSVPKLAP